MFQPPIHFLMCDLDGTLVDSFHDITHSCRCLLDEVGGRQLHDEEIRPCIGRGITYLVGEVLRVAGVNVDKHRITETAMKVDAAPTVLIDKNRQTPAIPLDTAVMRFREIYGRHALDATHLYPGVSDTLAALHASHGDALTLAVVSNKPEAATREILAAFDIGKYFTFIAGGDTFAEMKPSPLPIRRMMERNNSTPAETAIIGDSVYDLSAGKAAGVRTIAALYGFQDAETLKALDPDFAVSAFSDILRYL